MKTLHYSIIVVIIVTVFFGMHYVFAQSNNTQIQNGVSYTNSTCTDNIIQNIKTKYASFDEERAKTEAVNYDAFKSEVKNDTYIFRAVSQEWINDQVKCDVTFKNALVLFVVTDSSGTQRDVTILINPESYKPQGVDVKYDVPTHGGIMTEKIQSPLKQLESGIISDQVKCNQGFQLIFKQENMSPICVKPDTSKILIERGWATPIPGISFGGPTNIINDTQLKPKVTLSDYSYDGINKDNTTVSINNQTYYQTTLNYADYDLKKGTSIQFQNVTFAFPQGVMTTPGGAFIMLDMKFQDGSQETYGEHKINPDGSGAGGGIQIPTQYGPSSAKNSITVLSNHLNPQAGLTIYDDKIKLLVSTDNPDSSALKLSLVTNSKAIHYGESIWMEISVSNTLPMPFMALTKNDWKFNASSLNVCSSSPVGISILNGYYTEENMTEGKQLSLYNNNINCPYVLYEITGYQFEPSGNKILSCSDKAHNSCDAHEMRYQVSFSGYWSDNLHPFDIGTYTVIGADEWGHVAIEHFVVTNPESISITPENSQTLSINKNNGLVSGTRIIEINMNNFHQSRSPMIVQVYYPNDTLCRIDKIPSTSIQPDGFYKYNFTMSSADANAVYGNHRIIVTYNTQTVETIASIAVPP